MILPNQIIDESCKQFGVTRSDLVYRGKGRSNKLSHIRFITMNLLEEFTVLRPEQVSEFFNVDRCGIYYARSIFPVLMKDEKYREGYSQIKQNIQSMQKINYRRLSDNIWYYSNMLIEIGQSIQPDQWQSEKINGVEMVEVPNNIFFESPLPTGKKMLEVECKPDLPWAENHFQERISGIPSNPGKTYFDWPYYKNGKNFFQADGKFSHTYMERIWPAVAMDGTVQYGIRFKYGDLNDIIDRLRNNPTTRQAFLSIWHPEDQSNNDVRVPCTIGYWFYIRNGNLDMTYLIRSCDAIRHFKNDMYLSGRLCQFVAERIDCIPGNLSVWIGSLHAFKSDLYTLKKQINGKRI